MCSSEQYWKEEGNNKRMQLYCKISKILNILSYILTIAFIIYVLVLCTNSLFCMFDKLSCCSDNIEVLLTLNFKSMVLNSYKITFVVTMLMVMYYSYKRKYTIKKIISSLLIALMLLPISALLIYNFIMLGSLMSSFYLLVVFVVINCGINLFTKRVDNLYNIAVGSNEENKNRKGDKKLCKGK